jgi:hypothetical protein
VTYQEAVTSYTETGISKAEWPALVAIACEVVAKTGAYSAQLLYDGAMARGLTSKQILRMKTPELIGLMF